MNKSDYRFSIRSAAYLHVEHDDQVLLLKRKNTGYRDGEYSLIAGHKDEGETIAECMIREAHEEAGIRIFPDQLELVHIMHRIEDGEERYDFFFIAHSYEGTPENLEPEKCEELAWFTQDALPQETIPYVRYFVDMMRKGIFYSEYGWNDQKNS